MSTQKRRRRHPISKAELRRFILYNVGGAAYFWSGYGWFFVADRLLHWTLWWSRLSSNLLGVTVNFLIQHFVAFEGHKNSTPNTVITLRYIIITGIDFVIDYYIIRQLKLIGITPYIGSFISATFFVGWNYYWYKYWVFAEKPRHKRRV